MKVIYTEEALRDLDEILTYLAAKYPTVSAAFEKRSEPSSRGLVHGPRVRRRLPSVQPSELCR